MSDDKLTPEEIEDMYRIEAICKAAADLCSFIINSMQEKELGLAVENDSVAILFFDKLKVLYAHLSGDEDADRKFIIEHITEADSASGGADADPRQTSRSIRTSNRKLH